MLQQDGLQEDFGLIQASLHKCVGIHDSIRAINMSFVSDFKFMVGSWVDFDCQFQDDGYFRLVHP